MGCIGSYLPLAPLAERLLSPQVAAAGAELAGARGAGRPDLAHGASLFLRRVTIGPWSMRLP